MFIAPPNNFQQQLFESETIWHID